MKFTVEIEIEGIPNDTDPHAVLEGLVGDFVYEGVEDATGTRPTAVSLGIRKDLIEAIPHGPDTPDNWISAQDRRGHKDKSVWDPQTWVDEGFERNWGDAAVMDPCFEVLRRSVSEAGAAEYIVLCPTLLRRPLRFYFAGSWGSY